MEAASGPESSVCFDSITKRTHGSGLHRQLTGCIRIAVVALIAFATIQSVKADSVTWLINDVVFASGQTATGSFTLQNGDLTDWKIQLTGGSNPVLTNVTFAPGGSCIAFCGELYDATTPPPAKSQLALRTPLASDNTFSELLLGFDNSTVSQLASHNASIIGIPFAEVFDGFQVSGTTVGFLTSESLSNSATSASIILTPEPATAALLSMAFAILVFSRPRFRHQISRAALL
jgi:hypothetical protein